MEDRELEPREGGGGGAWFCFAYPGGFSSLCDFFCFTKVRGVGWASAAPLLDPPLQYLNCNYFLELIGVDLLVPIENFKLSTCS